MDFWCSSLTCTRSRRTPPSRPAGFDLDQGAAAGRSLTLRSTLSTGSPAMLCITSRHGLRRLPGCAKPMCRPSNPRYYAPSRARSPPQFRCALRRSLERMAVPTAPPANVLSRSSNCEPARSTHQSKARGLTPAHRHDRSDHGMSGRFNRVWTPERTGPLPSQRDLWTAVRSRHEAKGEACPR